MSALHPDPETLARYVRGELGREPRRELERHLAGCIACQSAVDAIPVPPGGGVRWQGHRFAARRAAAEKQAERQESLDGVLGALGPIIAAVSRGELTELLSAGEHRRRLLIRDEPRFRSPALCELLEARCRASWLTGLPETVEYAKLAVLIAESLPGDARAMALMHLGNACRVAAEQRRRQPAQLADMANTADTADTAEDGGLDAAEVGESGVFSRATELSLWELRDAFLERGMSFDAALVCLDLAVLFLRDGREDDLRRMVDESIPLLTERGADPFATDALRFLHDGEARQGRPLTVDLISRMAAFLQEARHDPRRESS